jgi:hypothetical protein
MTIPTVLFGAANLAILLVVLAYKGYAFTLLWCAYQRTELLNRSA